MMCHNDYTSLRATEEFVIYSFYMHGAPVTVRVVKESPNRLLGAVLITASPKINVMIGAGYGGLGDVFIFGRLVTQNARLLPQDSSSRVVRMT